VPFVCVATDLIDGEEIYLDSGFIYEALLASTALPGVFPPLKLNGRFLVDGCVLGGIPVDALRRKNPDFIIAVSVEKKRKTRFLKTSMDILLSVDEVRYNKLNDIAAAKADFLLEPDVAEFGWADFSQIKAIIDRGREEAENKLPLLKKKLRNRRVFGFLKRCP
jgi:NTE family protein